MIEEDIKHLDNLIRHITLVQQNCKKVADKLIENGEFEFAKNLIANSLEHDKSKFHGIEFEYLREGVDKDKFDLALKQHTSTNMHHAEFWADIKEMPRIFVCEMVCDWSARAADFGSDLRDYIDEKATKKYKFNKNCKIYREIKEFLDLLLEKPFKS